MNSPNLDPLLIGISEVAPMLGVCEKTLWRCARDGVIPSIRIGNRWLFSVESLRAWIVAQEGGGV